MRLFVALNFNELKDYFFELQKQIPEKDAKLTFPKDFHLTLKFLGEVNEDRIDEIKQKLGEINVEPFETEIDGIGFFNENFLRNVWVKADSGNLYELQKKIDQALPEFKNSNRFQAHITLSRVKWCKNKKEFVEKVRQIKTEEKKVRISGFELVKSTLAPEGPVYEVLERFPKAL